MIGAIKRLFQPRLVEHIPGQKRVYKNFFGFGKTVKTFERIEENIQNVDKKEAIKNLKIIEESELQPNSKIALSKLKELTASEQPINATTFLVTDKNGSIERANLSLKSGTASLRYKTSIPNGDFGKGEAKMKYNF